LRRLERPTLPLPPRHDLPSKALTVCGSYSLCASLLKIPPGTPPKACKTHIKGKPKPTKTRPELECVSSIVAEMRKVLWEAPSLPTAELHAALLHTSSCLPCCGIHLHVSMLHLHVSMLHLHVSMLQAWPTIHTATLLSNVVSFHRDAHTHTHTHTHTNTSVYLYTYLCIFMVTRRYTATRNGSRAHVRY
jgi:hypothetical protein